MQEVQPQQPLNTETTVKEYKNIKAYQKDAPNMTAQGWHVQDTTSHQPRQGVGRVVALGFVGAALFKPKPKIIVTYSRVLLPGQAPAHQGLSFGDRIEQVPQGLSFGEKVKWNREQIAQARLAKLQ